MEFRSSYWQGGRKLEIVNGKAYSANKIYTARSRSPDPPHVFKPPIKSSSSTSKPWLFNDPEMKRRKRVAKYKYYAVEGKFKSSIKKGFRWFKRKCSRIVHGY